jgi:PAS domain-containing protein
MIRATDSASNWARRVATLRAQAAKRNRDAASHELAEQALSICDALIVELAGAQLLCDQLRADLRLADAAWEHLFQIVPSACVLTDRASVILNSNRAASLLLNVSSTHLKGRELLVFSEDRETFRALLKDMEQARRPELRAELRLRPRERKPTMSHAHLIALPERHEAWLWIMTPAAAPLDVGCAGEDELSAAEESGGEAAVESIGRTIPRSLT